MFPENLSAAAHFVRDSSIPSYFDMNLWASLWHMTDECRQLSYLLRLVITQIDTQQGVGFLSLLKPKHILDEPPLVPQEFVFRTSE